MLGAIKGKLHSVQSDISEGLRQLRKKRPLSNRRLSSTVSFHLEFINADAGAELLQCYNEAWRCIHQATVENAEIGGRVDERLHLLVTTAERKANDLLQFQKELQRLNAVSEEISNLITETAKLEGLCEEVESSLAYLDVLCHTEEAQSMKLEKRFHLALHRERKMAELNEAKSAMAKEFLNEAKKLDRRRVQQQQEKVKVLQEAAEKDINTFKASGVVSNSLYNIAHDTNKSDQPDHPDHHHHSTTANNGDDDVDWDRIAPAFSAYDQHAFEEFLSDVKWEDSGIVVAGDAGNRTEEQTMEVVRKASNGNGPG